MHIDSQVHWGSDHKRIFKVHTVLSIAKEVQLDIE